MYTYIHIYELFIYLYVCSRVCWSRVFMCVDSSHTLESVQTASHCNTLHPSATHYSNVYVCIHQYFYSNLYIDILK